MATEELRGGVDAQGGAELQRLLEDRRGEGVVDEHRDVPRSGDDGPEVHEVQ